MRDVTKAKVLLIILLLLNIADNNYCNIEDIKHNSTNKTLCIEIATAYVQRCPTWFLPEFKNGTITCECRPHDNDVKCDANKHRVELGVHYCMTFDNSTNITYYGHCAYMTNKTGIHLYNTLPEDINDLNDFMCGSLNRTGLLCSQCKDGLGPAVLSNKMACVECLDSRYGWLLYLSLTMFPTTVLCMVIIVFRFDATSAPMNIFIITCQLLTFFDNSWNIDLSYDTNKKGFSLLAELLMTFYAFWNLDFFRYFIPPFCISSQMTTMQVVALDYTVALYPLILTAVIYYFIEFHDKGYRVCVWIWKPFRRCFICFRRTWNIKGSAVNAFATFFLLSFSKLITVSGNLLYYVQPKNMCGVKSKEYLAYYDTSMKLFSRRHLVFAIPAILITLIFIIFPTLLLLFYQNKHFQKLLGCLPLQLTLFHELVKNIQSCFKDGTGGTWDCRWFSGLYLLVRIFPFVINRSKDGIWWSTFGLVVLSTTVFLSQPYKNEVHNKVNIVAINTAVSYLVLLNVNSSKHLHHIPLWLTTLTVGVIPLFYFVFLALHKTLKHAPACRFIVDMFKKAVQKFKKQPEDYDVPPYRLLHPEQYPPLLPNTAETYDSI